MENLNMSFAHSTKTVLENNMQNMIEGLENFSLNNDFFLKRKFVCLEGMLEYLLFIPSKVNKRTKLLVMLHGCKQDAKDFSIGTQMNELAEKNNFIVLYPEQQKLNNSYRCWNWFEKKKESIGEALVIKKLTERIKNHFNINKVYVAGMSAGGAMACILSHDYPELFKAFGVHSGLPYRVCDTASNALKVMKQGRMTQEKFVFKSPGIVIHGKNDNIVNVINSEQIVEDLIGSYDKKLHAQINVGQNNGIDYNFIEYKNNKKVVAQYWLIDDLAHNWSGGDGEGSFTEQNSTSASGLIIDFFKKIEQ